MNYLQQAIEDELRLGGPLRRRDLLAALARRGVHVSDRRLRDEIKQMRRRGVLILSGDAGYWLAQSQGEVETFVQRELLARIADLRETAQAMQRAAREQLGRPVQERMF